MIQNYIKYSRSKGINMLHNHVSLVLIVNDVGNPMS